MIQWTSISLNTRMDTQLSHTDFATQIGLKTRFKNKWRVSNTDYSIYFFLKEGLGANRSTCFQIQSFSLIWVALSHTITYIYSVCAWERVDGYQKIDQQHKYLEANLDQHKLWSTSSRWPPPLLAPLHHNLPFIFCVKELVYKESEEKWVL